MKTLTLLLAMVGLGEPDRPRFSVMPGFLVTEAEVAHEPQPIVPVSSPYESAKLVALESKRNLIVCIGCELNRARPENVYIHVPSPWQGISGPALVESRYHGPVGSEPAWLEWTRTIYWRGGKWIGTGQQAVSSFQAPQRC